MITLDGSHGEGGGQILRTALALSMLTQKPFKIENIRKNRPTPGLKASHLAGIKILLELSDSIADGARIGSGELLFVPRPITKFRCEVNVETAGPVTLILQTILLPLIFGKKISRITIIGGTDVSWSPQIDYFSNVVLPSLQRFADIKIKLEKRGYYPKGQGKIELFVKPKHVISNGGELEGFQKTAIEKKLQFNIVSQKNLLFIKGTSHASNDLVDAKVAERQERAAKQALNHLNVPIIIRPNYSNTESVGSGVTLYACFSDTDEMSPYEPIIIGADSLGEKNKRSEAVGEEAAKKLLNEINSGAAVDSHLADNIIPFLGINGGSIKTGKITDHTLSNIYVTEKFLNIKFEVDKERNIISCRRIERAEESNN